MAPRYYINERAHNRADFKRCHMDGVKEWGKPIKNPQNSSNLHIAGPSATRAHLARPFHYTLLKVSRHVFPWAFQMHFIQLSNFSDSEGLCRPPIDSRFLFKKTLPSQIDVAQNMRNRMIESMPLKTTHFFRGHVPFSDRVSALYK
ncbi:hypothetical protein CEXT_775611 [Caerostris extrusa]|uniref:Uncharacterized protein n=1 Tax=Caerostris extrusa TaxID=172846 RepID=A0AAV4QYX8_CAEEX|nr:hypothetical protein CEXT_775611 [Caerostris extrusa]